MGDSARETDAGPRVPLGLGLRLVGVAILGGLAWSMRDRLVEAIDALVAVDPTLFALAFALYFVGLVVSALRAAIWLEAWGMPAGRRALVGDVLAATMLNALAVSGAGEAYRVQALVSRGATAVDAALAVFGDRLLGLAVFAVGAGLGLVWTGAAWMGLSLSGLAVVPIAAVCVMALGVAVACLPGLRARLLDRLRERSMPRGTLVLIVALAVVTLVTSAASVAVLASALGLEAPFDVVAATAPLVAVAAFLPITIGGIGVREAGYALLLAPVGVGAGGAIALGLAQYACFLVVAALGGAILIARMLARPGAPADPATDASTG